MADAIRPRRGPTPTDDPGHVFPDDAGNESAASDRIVNNVDLDWEMLNAKVMTAFASRY